MESSTLPANLSHTKLFIDGIWTDSATGSTLNVVNPATAETIGTVSCAGCADLDLALNAAKKGFLVWRRMAAFDRCKIMRQAAEIIRSRSDQVARTLTLQQGKPLAEAKSEVLNGADIIDWFAEESRRTYGRLIPARAMGIHHLVLKEPVGPVAGFSPWNFPINQAVRKIAIALAAGCSIILKGPEETPGPCAELVRAFDEAGVVAGALNLVFGIPAEISEYLIANPTIRKISFTGSTAVGKRLAALAGLHMKRTTMELGGHAPVIIFDDADLDLAAQVMALTKFRNAGQVCTAPTRFLIQRKAFGSFVDKFIIASKAVQVGDGLREGVTMGPLAHDRRLKAIENFVEDALEHGAEVEAGGTRIGNNGFFFAPTVLTQVPQDSRVMNDEPFGPVAIMIPFFELDDALAEANRLSYGLAAYAWTTSAATANRVGASVESGMLGINHVALALPELPFGGIKDSGYGSEGGVEALGDYLNTKSISQSGL